MAGYKKGTEGYYRQRSKQMQTLLTKFGSMEAVSNYYKEIGRKGGKNGTTGGFAANRVLASEAGKIGGRISKRGKAKKNLEVQ